MGGGGDAREFVGRPLTLQRVAPRIGAPPRATSRHRLRLRRRSRAPPASSPGGGSSGLWNSQGRPESVIGRVSGTWTRGTGGAAQFPCHIGMPRE